MDWFSSIVAPHASNFTVSLAIGSPFFAYFMTSQPLPQFSVVSAGQLQVQRIASCCFPPRAGARRLLDVSQECLWKLPGAQFDVIIKTNQPWKQCPSGLSSGSLRQRHRGLGLYKNEKEKLHSQKVGFSPCSAAWHPSCCRCTNSLPPGAGITCTTLPGLGNELSVFPTPHTVGTSQPGKVWKSGAGVWCVQQTEKCLSLLGESGNATFFSLLPSEALEVVGEMKISRRSLSFD